MDQRILAEARRALMPRVARWWLPASLAASLLLAVLLVQWQLADNSPPAHMTESDVLLEPAPVAVDQAAPPPAVDMPADARESAEAPVSSAPQPASKSPDLRERRAEVQATMAAPVQKRTEELPQTAAESAGALSNVMSRESYAESRTPEQWYADIEALRKSGRIEEANAELARFKSKYPDWLEHHQHPNP